MYDAVAFVKQLVEQRRVTQIADPCRNVGGECKGLLTGQYDYVTALFRKSVCCSRANESAPQDQNILRTHDGDSGDRNCA